METMNHPVIPSYEEIQKDKNRVELKKKGSNLKKGTLSPKHKKESYPLLINEESKQVIEMTYRVPSYSPLDDEYSGSMSQYLIDGG